MLVVQDYARCSCGAWSIYLEDGRSINAKMSLRKLNELYGLEFNKKDRLNDHCNCNYCVNNWGLDLCGCGSGYKFGKCKECNGEYGVAQSLERGFVSSCDSNFGARNKWF
jgi:hypothetical protein